MAGDYLPIRLDLWDDPRIVRMARELGCQRATMVGACVRFWSAGNLYSSDGALQGYVEQDVDALVGIDGFAHALEAVGWLKITEKGVTIPKFDRWNTHSAKRRLADRDRKRAVRSASAKRPQRVRRKADTSGTTETGTNTDTPPPTPSGKAEGDRWGAVVLDLREAGVLAATKAADVARANGATPEQVAAVLAHWRTIKHRLTDPPRELYDRVCALQPGQSAADGWPRFAETKYHKANRQPVVNDDERAAVTVALAPFKRQAPNR